MSGRGLGVDVGSTAIRVVAGAMKKGVFTLERYIAVDLDDAAEIDPAEAGEALAEELREAKLKGDARCGLTGRDVILRYTQVPPVPDWQLRQLMEFEIKELVEQSGEPLAADFNIIPVGSEIGSDDTVLLALAKPAILESRGAILAASGLGLRAFTPNAIALFNAFKHSGEHSGTTLLLHLGAKNVDAAIVRDGDLLFARNLSGGGDVFDEALSASFNVSKTKARQLKTDLADVSPAESGVKKATSPQADKVSRALAGALGQLFSMVQSSVMFAKSQTGQNEVKLDRVLLSGGGSLVSGLDAWLHSNLGIEVKRFDPFEGVDLSAVGDALDDEAERARAVVALGLALGSAAPNAYSLDILPAAAKRSRAFKDRTVFAIAAGAAVVLLLALYAWRAQADHSLVSKDLKDLSAEADKLSRRNREFDELLVQRDADGQRLAELEVKGVIGVGLTRALSLVQRHLPPDLYVKSISTPALKDPELGIEGEPRRVIVVKGEGREGAEGLATTFNRFAEAIQGDPELPVKPKTATAPATAKKKFEWELKLNFSRLPPKATEDEAPAAPGGP